MPVSAGDRRYGTTSLLVHHSAYRLSDISAYATTCHLYLWIGFRQLPGQGDTAGPAQSGYRPAGWAEPLHSTETRRNSAQGVDTGAQGGDTRVHPARSDTGTNGGGGVRGDWGRDGQLRDVARDQLSSPT